MKFTHLHVHSHYSLLDGLSKIPELVGRAKELGMDSLALTDHGVMYGAIPFYNACLEAGIKPIIGVEAYIAPRGLADKSGKVDADYYHLTLLASSDIGYKNLLKLTTIAHIEGFYYKPRIDLEVLKQHSEGLIALSGCMRGELARAVMNRSDAEVKTVLDKYHDIFGRDNFYIEIQRNSKTPDTQESQLTEKLIKLAKAENLKLVATADCHYINPEDAEAQDLLICIGTGRNVTDSDRMNMLGFDLSLKTAEQMAEKFADVPEAVSNTQEVADKCQLEIKTNQRYFPQVVVPEGKTTAEYLRELTNERAFLLYGKNGVIPEEVQKRIDYELDIIIKKGFDTYFLMVADVVEMAHKIGAVTNTRGSAAGSIVGRALGITNVDPLYYELPFERFLTAHRPTPPDIDLDIADNRRDEVISLITEKYGHDKVAQIITFGTMMARAAVRDVGRAMGVPYAKCDQISKMIPFGKQGFHMTLTKALDLSTELKTAYDKDPETKRILDIAKKLEGGARHASVHAAGIVITPTNLTDYMPLQKEPDGERVITQYDMYALDVNASGEKALGVVKLDLLGIRNLSILEAAVKIAHARHGLDIDIANLPHPDKKTFKLLSEGHTFGVFQMGSSGITRYLMDLKPKSIFDIMAMIALYRPGPMGIIPEYIVRQHRPSKIDYFDPRMQEFLGRSLGLLVYQDDVLLTAINIAGYSWEEADKLRKAMGKKIPAEMAKQKEKFIKGCVKNGMQPHKAEELFALIEPFAAYGFGKAHAASYGIVSYQTAYMKANYTVEFMAALMTAESGDMPTIAEAVVECKSLGVQVLAPDVNESLANFTVIDEKNIRFGLSAIKNLGSDVVDLIIEQRKVAGKFSSIEDFVNRIRTRNFNKKSWEALAKSGALDSLGERNQLLANTDAVLEFTRSQQKEAASNQTSLFGAELIAKPKLKLREVEPATKRERLAWEKELLGLYVSSHPMEEYREQFAAVAQPINYVIENKVKASTIGGIVSRVQKIITKKGEPMAFIDLEDMGGLIEVLVFPTVLAKYPELIAEGKILLVKGKLSDKDGVPKLLADEIKEFGQQSLPQGEASVTIKVPAHATDELFGQLKQLFETHPGSMTVNLLIQEQKVKTPFKIELSEDLKLQIKQVLGS